MQDSQQLRRGNDDPNLPSWSLSIVDEGAVYCVVVGKERLQELQTLQATTQFTWASMRSLMQEEYMRARDKREKRKVE